MDCVSGQNGIIYHSGGTNGRYRRTARPVNERLQEARRPYRRKRASEATYQGSPKHDPSGKNSGNSRSGNSKKTIQGGFGVLDITVPRDRKATFEPMIIPKGGTRFTGFDNKIISMHARGMTTRDIKSCSEMK
jgi:hypothetical protein